MNLKERIAEDLKSAMKVQDKLRISVLRMILADIKIADTSGKPETKLIMLRLFVGIIKNSRRVVKNMKGYISRRR